MRNLTPPIKREIFEPKEIEQLTLPDGIQWRCQGCNRDWFGVWKSGELHVMHRKRNMVISGSVVAVCRFCHLENKIATEQVVIKVIQTNNENGYLISLMPAPTSQAMRLIQTYDLGIAEIQGTGDKGKITKEDVRTYLSVYRPELTI
jgi:hypothetical protein